MTTEKKIALAVLCVGILFPIAYEHFYGSYLRYTFGKADFISGGTLFYWITLFLPTVLYSRLRPAAFIGAQLATMSLFLLVDLGMSGDPKSDTIFWTLYFAWSVFAGLLSLYPARKKPKLFTRSWLSALISSAGYTYLSVVLAILILKLTTL
ncbi:hypothetical protein [Aggregatibacter sp.]